MLSPRPVLLAGLLVAGLLAPGAARALPEVEAAPQLTLRVWAAPETAPHPAPERFTAAADPAPAALSTRHLLAAGGATAVAVPTGLLLGTLWGSVPSNLFLAALPSVLLFAALPPLAVTSVLWWVDRELGASRRWWPVALAATGAHLAVLTGGILLGASTRNPGSAVAFALADITAVTGAALLAYRFTVR
jgi:hypothetical protein